ncbi:hypothetical protein Q4F19_14970 [Sphingomonas sp. BIUV-7]|uniref:Uncharacterized protein n=1 Tax=Sphingomonas natans TaxID=3063330 RepID=A0ABT8YBI7_9SPHN|nr:hypothetical protein [Sphingomonas sp. BIUV-7]MDO6415690.1 hypothetical protein [Sphingomonas sp. BIUV-7]
MNPEVPFGEVVRLVTILGSIAGRFRAGFGEIVDHVEGALEAWYTPAEDTRSDLRAAARALLRARSQRAKLLGTDLFRDPAWDMVLDLYGNTEQGGAMMISSLCHSARVPPTTALRYVYKLVEAGALLCEDHPSDQRRTMVRLAPHMPERMEELLSMLKTGG